VTHERNCFKLIAHVRMSNPRGRRIEPSQTFSSYGRVLKNEILYTYIRMTHYKLFSTILLTCKVSTSSNNYRLPHHPSITKSPLHNDT
jgi:hypothetical protein